MSLSLSFPPSLSSAISKASHGEEKGNKHAIPNNMTHAQKNKYTYLSPSINIHIFLTCKCPYINIYNFICM